MDLLFKNGSTVRSIIYVAYFSKINQIFNAQVSRHLDSGAVSPCSGMPALGKPYCPLQKAQEFKSCGLPITLTKQDRFKRI